jgi:hypothetical protein
MVESTELIPAEVSEEQARHLQLLDNPYLPESRVAKMTPALKRKFIDAIGKGASPTKAAEAIEVARGTAYYQRDVDPDFKEAWLEAQEHAADRYEDALAHLTIKTRNVGAVIFSLKNARPNKWKDRHDITARPPSSNLQASLPMGAELALLKMLHDRIEALEAGEEKVLEAGREVEAAR